MSGIQVFDLVCFLVGLILFLMGAFNVVVPRPAEGRPALNLVSLGLAVWILVPLVHLLASV